MIPGAYTRLHHACPNRSGISPAGAVESHSSETTTNRHREPAAPRSIERKSIGPFATATQADRAARQMCGAA